MSIKKVMIISAMPHTKIGGVETYNRKLIEIFDRLGYVIEEFIIKPKKEVDKEKSVSSTFETKVNYVGGISYFYPIHAKKAIENNLDRFDIVINASKIFSKKILSHKGHILIQHTPYENYVPSRPSQKLKWFFDRKILGLGVKEDVFEASRRSVFYSEYTNVKNYKGSYNIPLSASIMRHKKYEIKYLWAARLQNSQKGIKNLIKINKNIKKGEIIVVGSGADEKIVSDVFGDFWIGNKQQKELRDLMTRSEIFILTSNYEGAAYTVTEALCGGTPVILFDTFRHAKFYNQCDSVYLIKRNDTEAFYKKMIELSNLTLIEKKRKSKIALDFAKANLSDKIFEKKWRKILEEM